MVLLAADSGRLSRYREMISRIWVAFWRAFLSKMSMNESVLPSTEVASVAAGDGEY